MPTSYFYCCSTPLAQGSVVNPGNWGRILRMYTQQGSPNPWILTRELIYELVRVRSFPAKPSRLDCLFVCMSETDLTAFRANAGRIFDIGYEVELVDPQASNHLGDWSAANSQPTANMPAYENSGAPLLAGCRDHEARIGHNEPRAHYPRLAVINLSVLIYRMELMRLRQKERRSTRLRSAFPNNWRESNPRRTA